jgi:hypothetical protein
MGEAASRRNDDGEGGLIDDAAEFDLEVSSRTIQRLQVTIAKVGAAEEAARAAQSVVVTHQQALRESLAQIAEAAGYEMPQNYALSIDAKNNVLKVVAQRVDEQGRLVNVSSSSGDRQNGQHA